MKIECWHIGKTNASYLQEGYAIYEQRLKRYLPFNTLVIPDVKSGKKSSPAQIKKKEGESVLQRLQAEDYLILLDEKGKSYSSRQLAVQLERWMLLSHRRLIFLIGGAYGFDDNLYTRADAQLSLSPMTFSHQMIRLFFLEQLYRAVSILKNLPYHND